MPFDPIPDPVPPGYRDERIHQTALSHMKGIVADAAAIEPPWSRDSYIAIYPAWYTEGSLQAPRLLHELFHFFPNVTHAKSAAWENALAYQGFVGTVAGLAEGPQVTKMFPP